MKINPLLVVFALLAVLVAAMPSPNVPAPVFRVCDGCKASAHSDPITGLADGAQVQFASNGFAVDDLKLTCTSASCSWTTDAQGAYLCTPVDVCSFVGSGTARANPSVPFRDDHVGPCNWSQASTIPPPIAGFPPIPVQALPINVRWIAACNGRVTWASVHFYKDATGCTDGTTIGKVHFAGKCSQCDGEATNPVEPPGGGGN